MKKRVASVVAVVAVLAIVAFGAGCGSGSSINNEAEAQQRAALRQAHRRAAHKRAASLAKPKRRLDAKLRDGRRG